MPEGEATGGVTVAERAPRLTPGRPRPSGFRRLRPEEWLFAGFLLALAAVAAGAGLLFGGLAALVTGPLPVVALVVAAVSFALLRGYRRIRPSRQERIRRVAGAIGGTGRSFLPFAACVVSYLSLREITPHLDLPLADPALLEIDRAVFGTDVSRWLNDNLGSPAMTLVMALCYLSYGSAQAVYALIQDFRKSGSAYRDFSLAVAITAVLGYAGYLLVPGVGPHVYQTSLYPDPLPGHTGPLGAALDTVTAVQGPARDLFPSLHTAMTVVLMVFLWRDARRWFWVYLPVGMGLLLSTVYLRKHYVVDIAAGIIVAAVAIAIAGPINRWWYDSRGDSADPREPAAVPPPRRTRDGRAESVLRR